MGLVRDLAQIAAGPIAGFINALGARKVHRWTLDNIDTGERLEGQFGPINPTENPGNPNYAEHSSLNRDKPITMYTHGNADTFAFGIQWYAEHETDETPAKKIAVLKKWIKRMDDLARPPLVYFYVGDDAQLSFGPATIINIGDIVYFDPPKHLGGIRGVTTTVGLKAYTKWSLQSKPAPETRYHHSRQGDYYELVAWQEYRNPMLGDVVRKRNPEKVSLAVGDIVPLPSAEAIRSTTVKPRSIVFLNTQTTKVSPQKTLRQSAFDNHDRSYVSSIIKTEL